MLNNISTAFLNAFHCICFCPNRENLIIRTRVDNIPVGVGRIDILRNVYLNNEWNIEDVKRLHNIERCWAYGKVICDKPKLCVYFWNLAATGLAIWQLYVNECNRSAVVALAVGQFVTLSLGIFSQGFDIHNSKNDISELREPENGENASCSCAINILPGLAGLAIGAAGMITKITTNSPAGDILNILAPIVSATGLSIIQSRYEEEKEIIAERYVRYIQAP